MSSFNSPDILMPLDEYYDQCVVPKPRIPKHYGFHVEKRQRQAARLQSYRDNPENDEDELEDEEEEEEIEGLNSSMEDSNMKQISFETNDFNKIYEEAESQNSTNNAAQEPKTEIPASSAQWRIAPINVNRPQGAAPLVPMDAPRGNPKAASSGFHDRKHKKRRYYCVNSNNNNSKQNNTSTFNRNNSVHSRLGQMSNRNQQRGKKATGQCLRNAYNGFKNKSENNRKNNNYNNNKNKKNNNTNNNKQQQQKVLMNIDGHFPNNRSKLIESSSLNSNLFASSGNNLNKNCFQSYQQQSNVNWQLGSNSLTALINSANQIRPSVNQASGMQSINNNNNMANIRPSVNQASGMQSINNNNNMANIRPSVNQASGMQSINNNNNMANIRPSVNQASGMQSINNNNNMANIRPSVNQASGMQSINNNNIMANIRPSVNQVSGMQSIINNNNMANNKSNTLMNYNYLPYNNNNIMNNNNNAIMNNNNDGIINNNNGILNNIMNNNNNGIMNNNNNIMNNNMANNNMSNMANINNITSRSGSKIETNSNMLPQSSNGVFGNQMSQVNRSVNQYGCSIASDSLRLADLMNLDANSIVNLNVAEVAKNAMMLLSTFVHNGDVQQQLSHLQNTTIGPANEPNGVDMNIRPQTTEFRMYHRFK